jgi:hypothetical protein
VSFCTDRVYNRVRTAAIRQVEKFLGNAGVVRPVQGLGSIAPSKLASLGHKIDADDALDADVLGDADAHLADRTEPVDRERAAIGNVRVCDGLPGRREHIGQVEEALVGGPSGTLIGPYCA